MKKAIVALSVSMALLVCSGVSGMSADGAALFKANCSSCHGAEATNSSENGVQRLRGQTSEALQKKLAGFTNGTYGGPKKMVMQQVVKRVSPEDLKSITDYIGSLK